MFLAEEFFAKDYNGIQLLLLLDRLKQKASIIQENVTAEFHVDEGILAPAFHRFLFFFSGWKAKVVLSR